MSASPSNPVDQRLLFALIVALALAYAAISTLSTGSGAIHEDMAEAYVWGSHLELGYYKHPPLWSWIAGGWFRVMPRTAWAFALLCAVNVVAGLWGAWLLIGRFAEGDKRLAALLLLLVTPLYAFSAFVFNANTIFVSLWPWTAYALVRALDERKLVDAVAFGVMAAAVMLSKYYGLVLLVACLAAALAHPNAKAYFTSPSPYLSGLVGALLISPHLWWLTQTGFLPFAYFHTETGHASAYSATTAVKLVAGDIALFGVVIAVVLVAAGAGLKRAPAHIAALVRRPRMRVMTILALGPLALTVIVGLIFRLKLSTNWTIGALPLIPLLLLEIAPPRRPARLVRVTGGLAILLALIGLAAAPFVERVRSQGSPTQPRRELARVATALWRAQTTAPLTVVGGEPILATEVAFYTPDRPAVFFRFDPRTSPWIDLHALAAQGFVAVCPAADTACVAGAVRYATGETRWTRVTLAHNVPGRAGPPQTFIIGVTAPRP